MRCICHNFLHKNKDDVQFGCLYLSIVIRSPPTICSLFFANTPTICFEVAIFKMYFDLKRARSCFERWFPDFLYKYNRSLWKKTLQGNYGAHHHGSPWIFLCLESRVVLYWDRRQRFCVREPWCDLLSIKQDRKALSLKKIAESRCSRVTRVGIVLVINCSLIPPSQNKFVNFVRPLFWDGGSTYSISKSLKF